MDGASRNRKQGADPDAALEWAPIRNVPRHFADTVEEGQEALARYMEDNRPEDLDQVQSAWDAVVADPRFGGAPSSFRADLLNRSAVARQWRAARDGSTAELDAALESLTEALALACAGHERALYLHTAGMTHLLRFQLDGEVSELDASFAVLQEAIGAAEGDARLRPLALSGTAAVLNARFRVIGARNDIDQAVALARAAVDETPADSPRAWRHRAISSEALSYRYSAFGAIDDLQQAIELRTPSSGQVDPRDRSALGSLLRRRWLALHDRRDLDRSIELIREALVASTPGNRPVNLTNLANALLERYGDTGAVSDARKAAEANELSVRLTSEGDWQLAARHNNAGNSLLALYGATGDTSDLSRAVRQHELAVAMTGPTAQERASREYNLGNAWRMTFERSGAAADARAATGAYRAACETGLALGVEWALEAAQVWAIWAAEREAWPDAADASTYGIEAVDQLFRRQLGRDEKEIWLARAAELPSLAAFCLSAERRWADAAVAFERGRAFLLSEAIERDGIDLDQLEKSGRRDLAERYRAASKAVRSTRAEAP